MTDRRSPCSLVVLLAACSIEQPDTLAVVEYVDVGVNVRLNAIDGKYVVGEQGVLLFDDRSVPNLPAVELHGARDCLISGCDDFIVGANGTVLVREGDGWTAIELGLDRDVHDITRSDGLIAVIGDDIVRVWSESTGPMAAFDPAPPDVAGWGVLRDILDHVIVGDGGRIYESADLHEWTRVASGTSEDLLALGVIDDDPSDAQPGELWAIGTAGTVLARRSDGWQRVDVGLDADLLDLSAGYVITSNRELLRLFADGSHTLITRFDHTPRSLEVVGYEAPVATVVGDHGMVAHVGLD